MGALCRVDSGPGGPVARLRRARGVLIPGAGKGLPQAVDRLCQPGDLLGEPLGVGLLSGEQAPDGLQLILDHLQLVDQFLLGHFQTLGLLNELLGGLCRPGLQLAGS